MPSTLEHVPGDSDESPETSVTLGADVGGNDAHAATQEHILALRKCLEECCGASYSEVLTKIQLVLRIDGSIQSWGKAGVDHVFIRPALGYATADVFVPAAEWETPARFRAFVGDGARAAVAEIGERAARRKQPLALDRLTQDVGHAVDRFLRDAV
jgi:hypothetical protein